ncbi:MAG: hypothetical protein VX100_11780 [Pseudomonadota bacterium]|nr:hypothetical protein [Pseudomonadota bacterium]
MLSLPNWIGLPLGVAFLISAAAIFLYIDKRAFLRRNEAGIEEYSSYSSMIFSSVFEKLLILIGVVLTIIGLFQSAYHGFQIFFG